MRGTAGPTCGGCGAPMPPEARYCGRCGRPSRRHLAGRRRSHSREVGAASRGAWVAALVYGGVLGGLFGAQPLAEAEPLAALLAWNGGLLALSVLALVLLGAGAWRASLGVQARAGEVLLGGAAGVVTLACGLILVRLAAALLGTGAGEEPWDASRPWVWLLLEVAVLPALVEEWLCRGVLWTALARLESPPLTLGATALLFGLLHLPGQGLVGAVDCLAAGLVFGWLRARTGSLAPGMAAHFVNNAIALWVFSPLG